MELKTIAAQLYTVRDFIQTPEDIAKSLRRVRDIGYQSIQVSKMGPIDPKHFKDLTDELGLSICVTHTPIERLQWDLDAVIAEHKLWGCDYVGLGAMPQEYRSDKQTFRQFIKDIAPIADTIHKSGLHFVYHNHDFEFEKFDGVMGMEMLLGETDPTTFGFIIDTYWIQAGGANPVDWIHKVRGRMGVVHFKDMAIQNRKQIFAEVGQGNLDWPAIITACRATGVKWYAIEQDKCLRDPFESLTMSFQYLQQFV